MKTVIVGQKVKCRPYLGLLQFDRPVQEEAFDGVITLVNEEHHWFQVEYDKGKSRVCFQFNDIGKTVKLI